MTHLGNKKPPVDLVLTVPAAGGSYCYMLTRHAGGTFQIQVNGRFDQPDGHPVEKANVDSTSQLGRRQIHINTNMGLPPEGASLNRMWESA